MLQTNVPVVILFIVWIFMHVIQITPICLILNCPRVPWDLFAAWIRFTSIDYSVYQGNSLFTLSSLLLPIVQESSSQLKGWPLDPHTQSSFLHAAHEFRFQTCRVGSKGRGSAWNNRAIYHSDSTNKMVMVCPSGSSVWSSMDVGLCKFWTCCSRDLRTNLHQTICVTHTHVSHIASPR